MIEAKYLHKICVKQYWKQGKGLIGKPQEGNKNNFLIKTSKADCMTLIRTIKMTT